MRIEDCWFPIVRPLKRPRQKPESQNRRWMLWYSSITLYLPINSNAAHVWVQSRARERRLHRQASSPLPMDCVANKGSGHRKRMMTKIGTGKFHNRARKRPLEGQREWNERTMVVQVIALRSLRSASRIGIMSIFQTSNTCSRRTKEKIIAEPASWYNWPSEPLTAHAIRERHIDHSKTRKICRKDVM